MGVFGGRRAKLIAEVTTTRISPRPTLALSASAPKVLVICTANVSRSPLCAELFRSRSASTGVDIQVASAGISAVQLQVDDLAVQAGYEFGVNISGHQPRQVTRALLNTAGADLVICMTRAHVREIVLIDESAWPRTFTLKELAFRLQLNSAAIEGAPRAWRELIGSRRSMTDLMGESAQDDIADPYGRSRATHLKVAQEMATAVGSVLQELSGCVVSA